MWYKLSCDPFLWIFLIKVVIFYFVCVWRCSQRNGSFFFHFHFFLFILGALLQFDRFEPEGGKIREIDFSRLILAHAALNDQGKKKLLKRVKREYGRNLAPVSRQEQNSLERESKRKISPLATFSGNVL